jgi:HEAT repeat protein
VPIRASSSKQIDALIADLGASGTVKRETAVARLTLLGERAVERLIAAAQSDAGPEARAGAWRALEAIGDARALDAALAALAAPQLEPAIAAAAISLVRGHVRGIHGAAAVDRLAQVLLDRGRHEIVRLAALRALRELDPAAIAPIVASLADDPSDTIRAAASITRPADAPVDDHPDAIVAEAAGGSLPDHPAALLQALKLTAGAVEVEILHQVIARVREREGSEPAEVRDQWRLTRAAAHVALANRGSRIALYDLRESLETAKKPLPVEFLAAITLIGDASCVEALAGAYVKTKDVWWRQHLARAFRDIVAREHLTRRHAALKKIEKRWPGALDGLWAGGAGGAGGAR